MANHAPLRRYYYLFFRLINGQKATKQELIEHLKNNDFKVSERMIERDLAVFRNEFKLNVICDKSDYTYFINKDEADKSTDNFKRFLEIMNNADVLINVLLKDKTLIKYLSFGNNTEFKGLHWLEPVLKAIAKKKKILFKHCSYQSEEEREYKAIPLFCRVYQNRWYLIAAINENKAIRTFGLDRISALQITDEKYEPFNTQEYRKKFDNIIGLIYDDSEPEEVILSFTKLQGYYVKALPLHSSQKILVDNDNETRVSLRVIPNFELEQQLLMYAESVKVLAPDWLAKRLVERMQAAINNYK